jgi:hypothetical protein
MLLGAFVITLPIFEVPDPMSVAARWMSYVHRLRRVLADADVTVTIHTICAVGFLMSEGIDDRRAS